MISLKQIDYLLAVEQTRSFGRAADACAVTPAALSSAVNALEQHVGFQVFERDRQQVSITSRGQQLLSKARLAQRAMDDLNGLAKPLTARQRVRVGFADGTCESIATQLLLTLDRENCQLTLSFTEGETQCLMQQVRRGFLDAAVVALPNKHPGLLSFPFWEERFVVVARRDDAMARKAVVSQSDLEASNLMLLNPAACHREHALAAAGLAASASSTFSAASIHTLIACVRSGLGCTLLPETAVALLAAEDPELVALPLENPGPHRQLACLIRPDYPEFSTLEYLMRVMQTQLSASLERRHEHDSAQGTTTYLPIEAIRRRAWKR